MTERLAAPPLPEWLEQQLPFTRYTIEIDDGLRMHVMEQGEGRPVICFHGNPTWGYLFRLVAAELEGEPFRVIMPDMIGLGLSDRVVDRRNFTLANHVRWMESLVGALELEDVVAVVQDWGGPIGLHSMSQHPGLMTGLVVMNTTIGAPKPGFTPTAFHRVFSTGAGELMSRWLGLPQRAMRFAQGDPGSISGIVHKSYMYPLRGPRGHEAVIDFVRMVPDDMDHPSVPFLREQGEFAMSFEGPAAIVWGDRDPVLGRLRRRVSRQLPDVEVTATDAGHFLQEEVPDRVAEAIRSVAERS